MSEIELKACPFCGGRDFRDFEGLAWSRTPECRGCGARAMGPFSDVRRNPVDAWNTRAPQWQPIESAPEDGKCLVAVETDEGWWYGQLERDKRGNWIHEGEPTYCKSYYFNPHSWQPLPAPPEVEG